MKLRKLALAALVIVGFVTPAAAQTYSFGDLLTGGSQAPDTGGGPTWATMSILNTTGTTYSFTLTALSNFAATFGGSGAFIREAEFNTDGTQGTIGTPILAAGSWGVSSITGSNASGSGSISWDFGDVFGGGQDRLTSGESVSWTQTFGSALNLQDPFVLLHVQNLQGGDSGKYVPATPIPEPETYAMMLAGLGLLGFVARRRRQNLGNVVPA